MFDLKNKTVAVVGVSADAAKYGSKIFKTLKHDGADIYAVGRQDVKVMGEQVYKSLSELPKKPVLVIMVVPPAAAMPVVEEAVKLGVKEIWFQPGAENEEAENFAKNNGVAVTSHACIMVRGGYW
ncbi:MAG: CoA-binding protein [Elusimicrobium sp.]|jgi:predicted CoA-binding protein|nr:CoA-binding protein [Elusimicrobium sp.]